MIGETLEADMLCKLAAAPAANKVVNTTAASATRLFLGVKYSRLALPSARQYPARRLSIRDKNGPTTSRDAGQLAAKKLEIAQK